MFIMYDYFMRTTLTIDDDVAFDLKRMRKNAPEKPFKVLVNETLRRGLQSPKTTPAQKPFVVRSRPVGIADKVDLDNIEEALNILEGADRKW